MLRFGMDTCTRYGLNAAVLEYTAFPDSSNTEQPGFSSAHFFAFSSDLNAPFCEDASAQVFRTRYQISVSIGAGEDASPSVPRMHYRIVIIFSPYPATVDHHFTAGFSFCPSHSTYSAQPLVTYLNRGSMQVFLSASVEA